MEYIVASLDWYLSKLQYLATSEMIWIAPQAIVLLDLRVYVILATPPFVTIVASVMVMLFHDFVTKQVIDLATDVTESFGVEKLWMDVEFAVETTLVR